MQKSNFHLAVPLVVTLMAGSTLTACASEPDPAAPRWTASASPEAAEPLFASDEEALAAAEAAYSAYQAAFNVVAFTGGEEVSLLDAVADGVALERGLAHAKDYSDAGIYQTGLIAFSTHKAQSLKYSAGGTATLILHVCDDVSEVSFWSANGESVTNSDQNIRMPFEITIAPVDGKGLVLIEKSFFTGDDYCSGS